MSRTLREDPYAPGTDTEASEGGDINEDLSNQAPDDPD